MRDNLPIKTKRVLLGEKGSTSSLTALPIKYQGEFRDANNLRCAWHLKNILQHCISGISYCTILEKTMDYTSILKFLAVVVHIYKSYTFPFQTTPTLPKQCWVYVNASSTLRGTMEHYSTLIGGRKGGGPLVSFQWSYCKYDETIGGAIVNDLSRIVEQI